MSTETAPPPVNPKPKAAEKTPGPTQVRVDNAYGASRVGGTDARKGERWVIGTRKGPGLSGGLTAYRMADGYTPDLSKVNGSVTLSLNEASYVTAILTMQSL